MVCTFQKSCHLLKLSKMLLGNIYKWLLVQGNGAITRVMVPLPDLQIAKSLQDKSDRGVISCKGKFFKTLG